MVKLKSSPQDFIVEEIPFTSLNNSGTYALCKLEKINYTTQRAITHIAKALGIPTKFISYAGTKDKYAQTTQHIAIKGVSKEKISSLDLKDITLTYLHHQRTHLNLGDLEGNSFKIIVREIPKEFLLSSSITSLNSFVVPNYFDEQRFSTNNVAIGLAILKKDFSKAVNLIKEDCDYNQAISSHLENRPNDFIGALQILPKKTLLFFIHAIQSKIFNDSLAMHIKDFAKRNNYDILTRAYSQGTFVFLQDPFLLKELVASSPSISLIGYDSLPTPYEQEILTSLQITTRDFIIRQIPFLTLEGSKRSIASPVTNFSINSLSLDENDLFQKTTCSFTLQKGSYATIVIKQFFDNLFINLIIYITKIY